MNSWHYESMVRLLEDLPSKDFVYIYDSCLGGLYSSSKCLDPEYLYCSSCGSTDMQVDSGYVSKLLEKYRKKLHDSEELSKFLEDKDIKDILGVNIDDPKCPNGGDYCPSLSASSLSDLRAKVGSDRYDINCKACMIINI